jgi:phenylalanyl-tRNA synthetase beta chain
MQISYNWIQQFIDIKQSASQSAHLLTMAGIETEAISIDNEEHLVIEITPNRGDCLSVLGLARELSAITNIPLKKHSDKLINFETNSNISIEIKDADICSRYAGIVIKGITVSESPDWLKSRLISSGIRAVNNVVDITNYIQIELGQPLHAFDLASLNGNAISINYAGKDQTLKTIDGIDRVLPEDAITIFDKSRPIAIGGIMGGFDTEITNKTTDIFLESAYFNPALIRAASRKLGLKTDSSYRFERGTDILNVVEALKGAAGLVIELCGGAAMQIIDIYPLKYKPIEIVFDRINVKRLLGIEIANDEIDRILTSLGFVINLTNKTVSPPSYRGDMELEADIIEEIARIYGYDRIPSIMPKTEISINSGQGGFSDRFLIMDYMKQAGFTEVINYSFMSAQTLSKLNIPVSDERMRAVSIKNPLRKDHTLMRTIILPSLINNLVFNLNRGTDDINIYEISKTFIKTDDILPKEELILYGMSYSSNNQALWNEPAGLFYRIKGLVQGLFEGYGLNDYRYQPSEQPFLFKGQALSITYGQKETGYMGMLSSDVVTNIDIKLKNPMIAVFSINLDIFLNLQKKTLKYAPISKYPVINRDIAMLVDSAIPAGVIEELIIKFPDKLIADAEVFDSYAGKNIPKGKKNLAFHVTFKSSERTLVETEVDELHNRLVEYVVSVTGGERRK